ncbi:TRAP transporter small permease subunit [Aquimarina sp. 2-A2]|uniref:TRAP transporter small permease subunit n=1 Tax=Aquimarina sp. 2-A2 TaxID=3382644 RepID=UPI00387F2D03
MDRIITLIDWISKKIGELVSWFSVFLAIIIGLDVVIRYIFQFTYIWVIETEIYLFGFMFLLASGYTFQFQKHVRVDLFYARFSEKGKAWIDLIGGVLFLIPWCYVVIASSWYYVTISYGMNESSAQPGGLPALYILKFSITLGFLLLLLQGISDILKSIRTIFKQYI